MPTAHNPYELAALLAVLAAQMFLAWLQFKATGKMTLLEHHMNHIREELVATTRSDAHQKGMRDQEAAMKAQAKLDSGKLGESIDGES
jgi:hypothetical protein